MDGTEGVKFYRRRDSTETNPKLATRLRTALLFTLLAVLILATVAAGVTAYVESSDVQDENLLSVAHLVKTNQIDVRYDKDLYRDDDYDDGVQVWEISKRHGRFPISKNISRGYHTLSAKDKRWRVYVTENVFSQRRYAIVQKLSVKTDLAKKSALNTALPLMGLFLFVPILITLIVRHSFRPLNKLGEKVSGSDSLQLDLASRNEIPVEVLPFVSSIDLLLQKNAAYNQRQRRFIADAAHELRTPITALSLEVDNLQKSKNEVTRQEREGALKKSIDRLQRLVSQLLDLARAQAADVEKRTTVCMNEVLKTQIADLYLLAERKDIEIVVNRNDKVYVQDINKQLQHLLRNALSNAIKFSPAKSQITIDLVAEGGQAVFCVSDNGPGVKEEHLSHLHEPFYRPVEQATGPGAGLGLAICHEIALQLNGMLALENRSTGGFRFCYRQSLVQPG